MARRAFGAVLVCAACAPPPSVPHLSPVSAGKFLVRVFTQPSPVRTVASAGRYVFVATDHAVERWSTDGVKAVSSEPIVALASSPDDSKVWILTASGLSQYDPATDTSTTPQPAGSDISSGASLAPADDGAWVGTAHGLYHAGDGAWTATAITDPIHALLRVHDWLWIATSTGLVARKPTGELVRIADSIAEPRLLVPLPDEQVLAIGTDADGKERLAFGHELAWITYRALPDVHWDAATARGNGAVLMGGGRIYRIAPADDHTRPLARDGLRLVALAEAQPAWSIEPIDLLLPPNATALGATGDQLLIGTRDLGTARYREADVRPLEWMRRRQMFDDARTLSVACANPTDCWIATGAHGAWHWAKDHFVTGGPGDQLVLAVARDNSGAILALHRGDAETAIHVSKIERTGWTPLPKLTITTPGDAPEVSFARASNNQLWVGLSYRDAGQRHPYGVATVDVATTRTTYHTEPVGIVDGDVRGATAWFATTEGVARLAPNGTVKLWQRDERVRAIAMRLDGTAAIATDQGAGIFDGKTWEFPAALRFDLRDAVATKHGQLWMATERGIVAYDGKKVRRIDLRRGLAENEVLDLAIDQFDRVWARGPGSLTLVSQ